MYAYIHIIYQHLIHASQQQRKETSVERSLVGKKIMSNE